ncbi:MAG: T9SS type A sorting domain-containing protein [Bacteroidetes bacterium]|nr:T9SS type A sorting domain-containing protein [Bacteroidota bacterium]
MGTEIISNVNVKFLKPPQLSNLSALPTVNTFSGDTMIWNIASLNPFQQGDIVITDSVFVNATLGDTANAYAWIEPIVADTTPQNNKSTSSNIISGSIDPNDKSVSSEAVLPNSTGFLEYIIRFQNTGTDTAFAVMVMDTLSSLLNVSSMEMISASHSYDLWIENGVAKWNFIKILLPDSNTNELESHGFVKFRIKPLPGLMVTDSIPNAASIYFDYNSAVTTNTIVVNVLNTTQVKELQEIDMQIFPNPVQESLRIVNQQAGALGKIELINASGKVLETKTISSSNYTWNLQHLPTGTYILKGQGWGQKVVKE